MRWWLVSHMGRPFRECSTPWQQPKKGYTPNQHSRLIYVSGCGGRGSTQVTSHPGSRGSIFLGPAHTHTCPLSLPGPLLLLLEEDQAGGGGRGGR